MTRLPGALFVVDIRRENIAVREANKLNIPIFAMVDTNTDPNKVDFGIPSNDDASKSIEIILKKVTESVKEGLQQRDKEKAENEAKKEKDDDHENKTKEEKKDK
jgi:small subunit ribosomal protein S2